MKKRPAKAPKDVSAARFKAECLALFDRVAEAREVYIVTKRGRPVAEVRPVDSAGPAGPLAGSVRVVGDIVGPVLEDWDAGG